MLNTTKHVLCCTFRVAYPVNYAYLPLFTHTLAAGPHHAIYKTVTTTAFAGDADGDADIINETLWS